MTKDGGTMIYDFDDKVCVREAVHNALREVMENLPGAAKHAVGGLLEETLFGDIERGHSVTDIY